jgi:transcriptional regulator with XRE-family HTH domain
MKIKKKGKQAKKVRGPYWGLDGPKAFRRAKDELNLSYQQMADALGANRHALWKWYHGLRRPMVPMRVKLKKEFEIHEATWLTASERSSLETVVRSLSGRTLTRSSSMARQRALQALGRDRE